MDLAKVYMILDWPTPKDRKQLQRFPWFANFYCKFIKNYSQVLTPLHALTSVKTRFLWNDQAEATFAKLKRMFASAPVLHSADLNRPFIMEVDCL